MYKLIISLMVCWLSVSSLWAQSKKLLDPLEETLQYLNEKLSFYYVENPNNITDKAIKLDTKVIASGKRVEPFWHDSTLAPLPQMLEGLFGEIGKEGFAPLQEYAMNILKIQDKPVQVWLYNDKEPLEDHPKGKYNPCTDLSDYVWPCANAFSREEKESDFWTGYMHLGVSNIVPYSNTAEQPDMNALEHDAQATFLHMLMHTQAPSDLRAHEFHPYETDKWYESGEEKHYIVEASPTMQLAYHEGIANIHMLDYHTSESDRVFKWFYDNDYLLVETEFDPENENISTEAWLYHQIREVAGEGIPIPSRPNHRGYKIRDLPPKFIMHNGMVIGLLFSSFSHWLNIEELIAKTYADITGTSRPASRLATLFKYACEAGLPEGKTVFTVFDLPENGPKPYLLPLSYADFFTACKTQDKSEFSEIFEGELPQPWIDLYWDTTREKVRKAVLKENGEMIDIEYKTDIYYAIEKALNMRD